jgi:peptidyl-prolyl cis-trans isomerase A (cyclophilin A)
MLRSVLIFSTLWALVLAQDPVSPDFFQVKFDTNVVDVDGNAAEPIVFDVTRAWAPYGADRFYALIEDKYYDQAAFFRVVPDFVVHNHFLLL